MADNIKQIKVEGVSYDLNAKYIQDGSGNPKTWQNIADMINAGVKLVTDNARKEAAGDGAIGAPATTAGDTATGSAGAGAASNTGAGGAIDTTVSITDTAGAPTVTGSGGGATVTSAAAGAATITSTSAGAHTHSVTIAAHSHSVTVGAHSHTITPTTNTFTYDLKVPDHSHSYTKPTAHTHSIAQHTHSVTVKGNNN